MTNGSHGSQEKNLDAENVFALEASPSASCDRSDCKSDVAVVISVFMRLHLLESLVRMYLKQTASVTSVVVFISGTPYNEQFQQIALKLQKEDNRVDYMLTTHNLGYFGRFQAAIQCRTRYVAFSDDDLSPGPRFIESLVHAMQVPSLHGILGPRGVIYECPGSQIPCGQRYNGAHSAHKMPPSGSRVDALFSFWFMESDWVRKLFYKRPITWKTAEDMQLSYVMRVFFGIETRMLNSSHPDFKAVDMRLMESNRSWIDTDDVAEVTLAGAIDDDVSKRHYNSLRDTVWNMLFALGNEAMGIPKPINERGLLLPSHAFATTGRCATYGFCIVLLPPGSDVATLAKQTSSTSGHPVFYVSPEADGVGSHAKISSITEMLYVVSAILRNRRPSELHFWNVDSFTNRAVHLLCVLHRVKCLLVEDMHV